MSDPEENSSVQRLISLLKTGKGHKVMLSVEECEAVHEMIAMLSGHNPEYVFDYYGAGEEDDPEDPSSTAFAKIYHACGQQIPPNLRQIVE